MSASLADARAAKERLAAALRDHPKVNGVGIARGAGEKVGALVTPTISVGMAQHHLAFAGSVTLRPTTLIAVVRDTVVSLARHGFTRFFFVNGHGGNIATVTAAFSEIYAERSMERMSNQPSIKCALRNWWDGPGINAIATPTLATDVGHLLLAAIERGVTGTLHCVGAEPIHRVDLARRAVAAFGLDPGLLAAGPPALAQGVTPPQRPFSQLDDVWTRTLDRIADRAAELRALLSEGATGEAYVKASRELSEIEPIVDRIDLLNREAALAPGAKVHIEGLRHNAPLSVDLTLVQRPPPSTTGA